MLANKNTLFLIANNLRSLMMGLVPIIKINDEFKTGVFTLKVVN